MYSNRIINNKVPSALKNNIIPTYSCCNDTENRGILMEENILGHNISHERKQQNMTQEQLAEFSDLTVNYLSKIERGIAKKVSADSLYRIAKALNVSMESFFLKDETTEQSIEVGPYHRQLDNYLSSLDMDKTEAICKHLLQVLKLSSK